MNGNEEKAILESKKTIERKVTPAQDDFLDYSEKFGWGKLEVAVKNSEPVMSRELEHDHKHT